MRVIFAKLPLLSKIWTLSDKLFINQTSNHHHCNWHAQEPICKDFQVILSSSSWSKTTLCIFKEQIWFPNEKCYGKNKLYFDQKEMLKVAWYSMHAGLCTSYGLYIYIIFETPHHWNTFRIFCNITQNSTPEENSFKMFHISSPILLFSYGKVKDIFGIRIKFHLGRAKGRGKRG